MLENASFLDYYNTFTYNFNQVQFCVNYYLLHQTYVLCYTLVFTQHLASHHFILANIALHRFLKLQWNEKTRKIHSKLHCILHCIL